MGLSQQTVWRTIQHFPTRSHILLQQTERGYRENVEVAQNHLHINLGQLEEEKIYKFWLIQGDTPVAAGLFEVDEEGKAILQVPQAVTPETYDAIGVSIEPRAGSVQPTGDIVMVGKSISPPEHIINLLRAFRSGRAYFFFNSIFSFLKKVNVTHLSILVALEKVTYTCFCFTNHYTTFRGDKRMVSEVIQ
jgi:hypothetical protein